MMNNTIKLALALAGTAAAIVGLASTASAEEDYEVSCLEGPPAGAVDYRGSDEAWIDANGVVLAWSVTEDSCLIYTQPAPINTQPAAHTPAQAPTADTWSLPATR